MACLFGESFVTVVFTVGYEGSSVSDVVCALSAEGVAAVADVRRHTTSRWKPDFSGSRLPVFLAKAGIGYERFPELGVPTAEREIVRSAAADDVERVWRSYRASLLGCGSRAAAFRRLEMFLVSAGGGVALLCYERTAEECHRRILADELAAATGRVVKHLSAPRQ